MEYSIELFVEGEGQNEEPFVLQRRNVPLVGDKIRVYGREYYTRETELFEVKERIWGGDDEKVELVVVKIW